MNGINTCTNSKYYRYFFFRLVITKEKQARGELFSINIRYNLGTGKNGLNPYIETRYAARPAAVSDNTI